MVRKAAPPDTSSLAPVSKPRPTTPFGARALSVGFVVMWSSGFVGGRLGTQTASTLSLMSWRFLILVPLIAGLIALVGVLSTRRVRFSPMLWGRQVVLGLLSQVVYLGGVVGAIECGVSAGTAAIIAALQPLLAGALAGPVLGERVAARQWIGLGVGFCGVVVVVGGDLSTGSAPAWAYALPFAGMLGLVAATLLEARQPSNVPLLEGLGVQCATSAVVFSAIAAAAGDFTGPHVADSSFWIAVAWFIALSTLGGYGFYWLTLRRTDATRVSALIYLSPPTTVVWAWLMFGDAITWTSLAGFAVCAAGVAVVFLPGRTEEAHPRDESSRGPALNSGCAPSGSGHKPAPPT